MMKVSLKTPVVLACTIFIITAVERGCFAESEGAVAGAGVVSRSGVNQVLKLDPVQVSLAVRTQLDNLQQRWWDDSPVGPTGPDIAKDILSSRPVTPDQQFAAVGLIKAFSGEDQNALRKILEEAQPQQKDPTLGEKTISDFNLWISLFSRNDHMKKSLAATAEDDPSFNHLRALFDRYAAAGNVALPPVVRADYKGPPTPKVEAALKLHPPLVNERPLRQGLPQAPPLPAADSVIAARIAGQTFPRIFQAWSGIQGISDWSENLPSHDLVWVGPGSMGYLGVKGNSAYPGLATAYAVDPAKVGLRKKAPNGVVLVEIRYYDAVENYLPPDHPWWKRDANGDRIPSSWQQMGAAYYLLDFANPSFREQFARQCKAIMATGVFDGLMFDWWAREDDMRLELLAAARQAIGDRALILVNTGNMFPERSKRLINGIFMEGFGAPFWSRDQMTGAPIQNIGLRAQEVLGKAQAELREPRINAFEAWGESGDQKKMRFATTLGLVQGSYSLYSVKGAGHAHPWYSFWNKGLGKPVSAAAPLGAATRREFEHGTVVFNPSADMPAQVSFTELRISRATGLAARDHTVAPGDGDIFIKN